LNKNRTVIYFTIGCFISFFLFGFVDNLKGPTIPSILRDLSFNYSIGGTIILANYFGFLLATLFIGLLANVIGRKKIILIAAFLVVFGLLGYSYFSSFLILALFMFVIGMGLGAIEIGANIIIVELQSKKKGMFLNVLAFLHGFGSILGPIFTNQIIKNDSDWRNVYLMTIILPIILFFYFIIFKYPETKYEVPAVKKKINIKKIFLKKHLILFYILIAVYVAAEVGVASWIIEFLQKIKDIPKSLSIFYLSLFFIFLTAGRLIGAFIVEKIGYLKILLICSCCSLVCLSLGIFGPKEFVLFLPLTGFFFSIVFPTATAAISDHAGEHLSSILAVTFAFAGIGGMIGPFVVGILSDKISIFEGFSLNIVFCAIMLITLVFLMLMKNRPAEKY